MKFLRADEKLKLEGDDGRKTAVVVERGGFAGWSRQRGWSRFSQACSSPVESDLIGWPPALWQKHKATQGTERGGTRR